ncbi:hypothetical protein [Marixanthomonas spongiae]|uniref:hypothetical protein n=1 Tax=Marixanthomonas spongiae TaxID=2174845 RepID=UPI001F0C38F3|nr:hypothetical protein [Marixanthomonas spongiae]
MKKLYIELKWAVIFMVTLLCWMLLEKTLGWHGENIADHWWMTMLFAPFAVLFIYWPYGKKEEGRTRKK